MAVVVQCFHCNAILELDDGFRGGVCRCSGCGSLLQVPRGDAGPPTGRVARPAGPPAPAAAGEKPRTGEGDTGQSSGRLDPTRYGPADLGGSSSGLGQVHRTRPISHVAMKARKPASGAATTEPAGEARKTDNPPQAPGDPKEGGTPLWLALLLAIATAAVIGGAIYMYLLDL